MISLVKCNPSQYRYSYKSYDFYVYKVGEKHWEIMINNDYFCIAETLHESRSKVIEKIESLKGVDNEDNIYSVNIN